jgi:diguanylate cyclase (GGDEF)-like protein
MPTERHNPGLHVSQAPDGPSDAPDPLLASLVESIHSGRGPIAISCVMGVIVNASAYALAGDPAFLWVQLPANVVVALGRIHRLAIWEARRRKGLTARDVDECDRGFLVWAALFSLLLGVTCFLLTAHADAPGAFALAAALVTGFSISFATGSAGRPLTMAAQIAGVAGPQLYAQLSLPIPLGGVWAVLTLGLVGAALLVGRFTRQRIVALHRANESNRLMAEIDMLTGLKNRHAMNRAGQIAMARAADRPDETLAVYLVDLDRFKQVNDTLGHAAGDAVLMETAARLLACAGRHDVARMGGDEFMVLARLSGGEREVEAFGARMLSRLSEPYDVAGAALMLGGSVGAAFPPRHGRDLDNLMICADRALYEAKRAGRNQLRLFDDELERRFADEHDIEIALEQAFERDELEVWRQPIHALMSGEVSGYEALVRWRHPTLGLVLPDRFITLAEQNGAIVRLGEIVLAKACRDAAGWAAALTIAVNVSPRQFSRPGVLVAAVRRALHDSGLDPSRLFLEITESFLMEDSPTTRAAIDEIAALGVRFSLDDFGRGFSSLAYIQKYPFSKIKIDREFVRNIPADKVSSAIVASVCLLAARIGMSVVAEGVETEVQRRALADLGVDLGQGYLFGRPQREADGQSSPAFAPMRRSG